jgi:ubiquinone/menaquinone biosynthesis C-methylase UbiE
MNQIQRTPTSLRELQHSYNQLFQGWMASHENTEQSIRILDLLQVKAGKKLLDIGSGIGTTLSIARSRGLNVVGIDISTVAVSQAIARYNLKPNLMIGSGENLPFPSRSFDYVVLLGSLEHFLDPARALCEVARVLKQTGRTAILVPNSHHLRAIYNVIKYGEIISDLQDYERFATRREWENLFVANGLRICSVHKYDTGMAQIYRPGREVFWTFYNIMFKLFGNRWIPFNLTYTFIFICESKI